MAVDRGICAPGGRLVAGLALRAGLYLVVADPVRQEGSVPALLPEPVARYRAQRTAVDERPFPENAEGEARGCFPGRVPRQHRAEPYVEAGFPAGVLRQHQLHVCCPSLKMTMMA